MQLYNSHFIEHETSILAALIVWLLQGVHNVMRLLMSNRFDYRISRVVRLEASEIDLFKIPLAYSTDSAVINRNAPLPHFVPVP